MIELFGRDDRRQKLAFKVKTTAVTVGRVLEASCGGSGLVVVIQMQ